MQAALDATALAMAKQAGSLSASALDRKSAEYFAAAFHRPEVRKIYAENDSYFAPALAKRMHAAYRSAGGAAEFHLLPPADSDGHGIIRSADAARLWLPLVAEFLSAHAPAKKATKPMPAG